MDDTIKIKQLFLKTKHEPYYPRTEAHGVIFEHDGDTTNVHEKLLALGDEIKEAVTGNVPDGSITEAKLDEALLEKIKSASAEPDETTITKTSTGKLRVKDAGITMAKLAQEVKDLMGGEPDGVTIEKTAAGKLKVKDGNFIKNIKIDGVTLTKTDDVVEIPKASATQYGLVKVEVTSDGVLKIVL